jgi:5-methylcytosine-specific restriction endonuclease McrA
LYQLVARRAGHRCELCRAPEVAFNFPFEVEHVVPPSRGGGDEPDNLAPSCRACNVRKGDAVAGFDEQTGGVVPLFNPRADRWADHFRLDPDCCERVGLTPAGRAMIVRLEMNHPLQVTARDVWARLRLYP